MSTVLFTRGTICGGAARHACSPDTSADGSLITVASSSDYDVFAKNTENVNEIKSDIIFNYSPSEIHETPMSFLFTTRIGKINLIKQFVGEPERLLERFDFTVVRAALVDSASVLVDDDFEKDELEKKLRIKHLNCPVSTMMRCMKYARKGYSFPLIESIKIFQDWEQRPIEYRSRLIELAESESLSPQEIEELEALLRID